MRSVQQYPIRGSAESIVKHRKLPQRGSGRSPGHNWGQAQRDWRNEIGEMRFGETMFGEMRFGETSFGKMRFGETSFGEMRFGETMFGEMRFGETSFGEMRLAK